MPNEVACNTFIEKSEGSACSLGLLNNSLTSPIQALGEIDISSCREWSKKHALAEAGAPAQTQGSQDALFHGQGRRPVGARSVHEVRERERREERQACEPEGRQRAENAAGGLFQHAHMENTVMETMVFAQSGKLLGLQFLPVALRLQVYHHS